MSETRLHNGATIGSGARKPRLPLGWLTGIVTVALCLLVAVEAINIALYDPWSDEVFLLSLAGVLQDVEIGTLSVLMFGSLLVLLALGLPLAFVTAAWGSCSCFWSVTRPC